MSVSVSTHVLDTGAGRPRERRARRALPGERGDRLGRDRRRRPDRALADDLDAGTYALVFWPPSPFFTRVELEVELADGHHHVPLLVSPYGCASYRGS